MHLSTSASENGEDSGELARMILFSTMIALDMALDAIIAEGGCTSTVRGLGRLRDWMNEA